MGLREKSCGALAALACLTLAVSGCGGGSGDASSGASGGSASIRVMLWGNDQDITSIKGAASAFESEHPEIKIEWESGDCAVDYAPCKTLVAGDNMPDVVVAGSWVYYQMVKDGVIADLSPYMERVGLSMEDFTPSVIKALTSPDDGETYGLPMGYNIQSLFYNKDMFDAAGLDYPPADGSYTYDDLREWAKKLTLDSNGNNGADVDFDASKTSQYGYYNMAVTGKEPGYGPVIAAFGGGIITGDRRDQCEADSEGTIAGFQWLQDVMWKDHSAITPQLYQEEAGDGRWVRGQVAMQQGSHEQVTAVQAQNPDLNYGIAALPKGPAGNASLMQIHAWVMSEQSEQKDAAFEFIKYMSTDGAGKQMGLIPAYKDLADGPDFAEAEGEPDNLQEAQIEPAEWPLTYTNVDPSTVWVSIDSQDGIAGAIEDITMNRKTAAEALDGICASKIQPFLDNAK